MASVSMMASFIGNVAVAPQTSSSTRRTLVMAKAAAKSDVSAVNYNVDVIKEEKESRGRRAAMFAAAAAARRGERRRRRRNVMLSVFRALVCYEIDGSKC
ncbi:uncharacterized protein A4U43_C08F9800 [Asparagus officinalis]|nr:uncharacterized protein A4U43_C08F9800 [Asparagus officinalis]